LLEEEQVSVKIEGHSVLVNKVKIFDDLITDASDPDKVPCWAEIWPASIGLACFLARQGNLEAETVLELGAGLGVPGVVAGIKGARITFSDFNRQALYFCDKNARSNRVKTHQTLLADWREFPDDLSYRMVLGSDIIYEPRLLPYLKKVLKDLLNKGSYLVLAHPSRKLSFTFVKELVQSIDTVEHCLNYEKVYLEDSLFNHYHIAVHSIHKGGKDSNQHLVDTIFQERSY